MERVGFSMPPASDAVGQASSIVGDPCRKGPRVASKNDSRPLFFLTFCYLLLRLKWGVNRQRDGTVHCG